MNEQNGECLRVDVDNGHMTVIMERDGRLHVLRHGQEWRECTGDNLIYLLAFQLNEAREKLAAIEEMKTQDTCPRCHGKGFSELPIGACPTCGKKA